MNPLLALLTYAVAVGVVAPRVLLQASWTHRAPALATAVWLTLSASFPLTIVLASSQLGAPTEHLHAGVIGLLHACGFGSGAVAPNPTTADRLAVAIPVGLAVALAGAFLFHLARAYLVRARHRDRLDKVGVRSERLRATIVPHATPNAYCLPGLRPRIVVSDGAVRLLTEEQLGAVLEHERAHVAGRHHLVIAATDAFHGTFPWLPLARHAREQAVLLLEMIADDRALRRHSHEVLATAMYEIAAGRTPKGTFGVGGTPALIRLRRILGPRRSTPPAVWGCIASTIVTVPTFPLLLACPLAM
ncbi:Zn-dependent protease with chaperone function [Streptomyces sp. PvR006]|uniref:M56 family metallopeptidase n=1 Tax=Streptomyces sp. PvR006 TaxID=2817860 RepID=UPI001AE4599A|nr:M56 family metallopeptidase [Streptomyces sp. PvR006]MBP2580028.1 Zn-dependent protease with chaperone function [Streptomyces sp. PvR006]